MFTIELARYNFVIPVVRQVSTLVRQASVGVCNAESLPRCSLPCYHHTWLDGRRSLSAYNSSAFYSFPCLVLIYTSLLASFAFHRLRDCTPRSGGEMQNAAILQSTPACKQLSQSQLTARASAYVLPVHFVPSRNTHFEARHVPVQMSAAHRSQSPSRGRTVDRLSVPEVAPAVSSHPDAIRRRKEAEERYLAVFVVMSCTSR